MYKRNTCIPMFIAVLFTKTKVWKLPRGPTTDECLKKKYTHIHTTEYNSIINKKEIMSFAGKWIDLEIVKPNEIRQAQRPNITCSCSFIDPKPRMMMMTRMTITIMGHECIWGTFWVAQHECGGEKEKVLKGEEDSIMKPTKRCF
jgi:hypothetical protein